MSDKSRCIACIASRRSVVDAFFLGYRAGFRMATAHTVQAIRGGEMIPVNEFCLEHDKMVIEAHVKELRELFGADCEEVSA